MLANHSFVLGDLNYRCSLPNSSRGLENNKTEKKLISQKMVQLADWKAFNDLDELTTALADRKVLVGFRTREWRRRCSVLGCLACLTPPPVVAAYPKFPPTFKLERKEGCHYNL